MNGKKGTLLQFNYKKAILLIHEKIVVLNIILKKVFPLLTSMGLG